MSNDDDRATTDFFAALDDSLDLQLPADILEEVERMSERIDFSQILDVDLTPDLPSPISNTNTQTPSGYSPSMNTNESSQSSETSRVADLLSSSTMETTRLTMFAEPYYGLKLRYRSDYQSTTNRQGFLKNRSPALTFQGPAIRFPAGYLNPTDQYQIRVSLVTVPCGPNALHYFHPYELENPTDEGSNDRPFNSVWYTVLPGDIELGMKSFPSLRIVKKTAAELRKHGALVVFNCQDNTGAGNHFKQSSASGSTIDQYSLNKSQLAFTVAKQINVDDQSTFELQPTTTVYSQEMIEGDPQTATADAGLSTTATTSRPALAPCRVYKFAPKYGFVDTQDDMLIFLTRKLDVKKDGGLQVRFECETSDGPWSETVPEIDLKDRMLSFKIPIFPFLIETMVHVNVTLSQNDQPVESLPFYYSPKFDPSLTAQANAIQTPSPVVRNVSNKRSALIFDSGHDGVDVRPTAQGEPLEPTNSPLPCGVAFTQMGYDYSVPLANPVPEDEQNRVMTKLAESVESLFLNNDDKPLLRTCRVFLKSKPQLLHDSLDGRHFDPVIRFIPVAVVEILQHRNARGESVLLHAARVNAIEVVQALLEHKKSCDLIDAIDEHNNNIFHILASNSAAQGTLDLVMRHLREQKISIRDRFDRPNDDHQTPLQVGVAQNNLAGVQRLLEEFRTSIYETHNGTGDNLVHLAVRGGHREMVESLIEDGGLMRHGGESNLNMTPVQLARSLKYDDIVKYLLEKYPEPDLVDEDSSDDD